MANEVQVASDVVSWAVGVPSIGVLAAYGLSIIRRRASEDSKVLREDKSYQSMLESYKKERDDMKAERDRMAEKLSSAEFDRNDAVSKVGKMSAEVEFLSKQVIELKSLIERLQSSLEQSRSEIHVVSIQNAKLTAQVSYLDELVDHRAKAKKEPIQLT